MFVFSVVFVAVYFCCFSTRLCSQQLCERPLALVPTPLQMFHAIDRYSDVSEHVTGEAQSTREINSADALREFALESARMVSQFSEGSSQSLGTAGASTLSGPDAAAVDEILPDHEMAMPEQESVVPTNGGVNCEIGKSMQTALAVQEEIQRRLHSDLGEAAVAYARKQREKAAEKATSKAQGTTAAKLAIIDTTAIIDRRVETMKERFEGLSKLAQTFEDLTDGEDDPRIVQARTDVSDNLAAVKADLDNKVFNLELARDELKNAPVATMDAVRSTKKSTSDTLVDFTSTKSAFAVLVIGVLQ